MIGNMAHYYPPNFEPSLFNGLPNNWNQGLLSPIQPIPLPYVFSLYQQQQNYGQSTNEQNNNNSQPFKLYDFDQNNRSEIIRLIFAFAGVSFSDKRVKQDGQDKFEDLIPIQKLPMLHVNNQFKLYELNAIVRYLAREFHLYGRANYEHAIVDTIYELTRRFQENLFEQMNNSTNAEQKNLAVTQFLTDHSTDYLNQLEQLYKTYHYNGPFYLGHRISIADLIVYQTINHLINIEPTLLDNYPNLQGARDCLEQCPQIINYLNKNKLKIIKKRNSTVPPPSNHVLHHRNRSHDEHKSSRHHRHQSKQPTSTVQIKQESKSPSTQTKDRPSTPPLLITEQSTSPTTELKENDPTTLSAIKEPGSPGIESEKNGRTLSSLKTQESRSAGIESSEKDAIFPLLTIEESPLFGIESREKYSATEESELPVIQSNKKDPAPILLKTEESESPSLESKEKESTLPPLTTEESPSRSLESEERDSTLSSSTIGELPLTGIQSKKKDPTRPSLTVEESRSTNFELKEKDQIPHLSTTEGSDIVNTQTIDIASTSASLIKEEPSSD